MTITLQKYINYLESLDQNFIPERILTYPHCYRGNYSDLAFSVNINTKNHSISDILKLSRSCDGKILNGYKGGKFKMNLSTRLFVTVDNSVLSTENEDLLTVNFLESLYSKAVNFRKETRYNLEQLTKEQLQNILAEVYLHLEGSRIELPKYINLVLDKCRLKFEKSLMKELNE